MLGLLSILLLASGETTPVRLAVPDFKASGTTAERVAVFSDAFAQQFIKQGFQVVTSSQIAAVLGAERQKELLGCGDGSASCMAELASAMGSEAIASASISKLDEGWVLNASLTSGVNGLALSGATIRAATDGALLDGIEREAPRMAREAVAKLRPGVSLTEARAGFRRWALVPLAACVVSAIAGGGLLVSANDTSAQLGGDGILGGARFTPAAAMALAADARRNQAIAVALFAVSGVAAVAAGMVLLLGGDVKASLTPTPGGAVATFTGRFP